MNDMFTNQLWYHTLMFATAPDTEGGSSGDSKTASTTQDAPEGTASDSEPTDTSTEHQDRGYPANKAITDMTDQEQAAYWKFHAQKWEGFARDRKDYAKVKRELDEIKRSQMTDHDRALEDARAEARTQALQESGTRLVEARLTGLLEGRGMDENEVKDRLQFVDKSKFLTGDGEVDTELVSNFLDGVAPTQEQQRQVWPDMGQGRRGNPAGQTAGGSVQSGRDLYANRHKTQQPAH